MPRPTAASLRPLTRAVLPAALCAAVGWACAAGPAAGLQDGTEPAAAADGADGGTADGVPDLPGVEQTAEGAKDGQDVYPRRLPAGYGAVGLSREQKEKVYAVQAKYDGRVDELLEEIAAIKNKQTAEIAEILTPGQRAYLAEWKKDRAAEREAARAEAEADAGDE